MFCRKCGNEIPDDSVFCLKCGTKVETIKKEEVITDAIYAIETVAANLDEEPSEYEKNTSESECVEEMRISSTAEQGVVCSDKSDNTEKRSGKAGIFLAVLLVAVSCVIIYIAVEQGKRCERSDCKNYKEEGSSYCSSHTCIESGCVSGRAYNSIYCYSHKQAHKCSVSSCDNTKTSGSEYCSKHKCEEYGCKEIKSEKGRFCVEHTIDMRKFLRLDSFSFDLNSAGGIELTFAGNNISDKQIKYVRFTLELRNSVGDIIKDEIKDKSTIDLEIVGPIWPKNVALMYEDVIGYNDTCGRLDIDEITIIYMDGTQKTGSFPYYTTGYKFYSK